jgi:hypothetical protein
MFTRFLNRTGVTCLLKQKGPRRSLGPLRETIIDYGRMCGDAASELNEQLTSGVAPTVAVV